MCDLDLAGVAAKQQGIFLNLDLTKMEESLEQLEKLEIPQSVMSNGLLFVWSNKASLDKVIRALSKKSFYYVENVVFGLFDYEKLLNLAENIQRKLPRKKDIETFFKQKKGAAEEVPAENKFTQASLLSFLQTTPFSLPAAERIEDYLANAESPFVKVSKVTLLIFRRVV